MWWKSRLRRGGTSRCRLAPHQSSAPDPASGLLDSAMTLGSVWRGNIVVDMVEVTVPVPTMLWNKLQTSITTGVATLSLINTLLDFFCEDVTFELILKYLMPLGDQPAVRKLLSDPNTLLISASQFLTLIPPYLKSTGDGDLDLDEG
ncbi:unnamed protein product [Dibothriocephalus latus]|uniref:Uncharacterized protein n=1 Tax=Dibothriocephalus latus TaxID=60516 RepID=A0A3P7MBB5_DIBLA|nr:unnamed protein product [Dibothriocephalus latus]